MHGAVAGGGAKFVKMPKGVAADEHAVVVIKGGERTV
jgi:hypothetical protein